MYYKIEDFLNSWKYETEATIKLFEGLNEHRLHELVHDDVRTCARLGWHITQSIGEMMERTGLKIDSHSEEQELYWTKKELIEAFRLAAEQCAEQIQQKWSDEDLQKTDNMYGEEWKRGSTLGVLVRHQAHHRGELVVVMRLLNMPVVGVYGPAREEWSKMGMPAAE